MARWWLYSCGLVSVLFLQGGLSSYTKSNVAYNKTTYQSSYYNYKTFKSEYAVDGVKACSGQQSMHQFMMTNVNQQFTYWEVYLEQHYFINSVNIYFRSEPIHRRRGIQVYTSERRHSLNMGHLCGVVNVSNVINDTITITCNVSARFVTLYQGTDNQRPDDLMSRRDTAMDFCEVEVYALICDPGFYGSSCDKECNNRHCTDNSPCDPLTGRCVDGCQQGWKGTDCVDDVDECAMNRANCSIDATCVNTIGSVICVCNAGYTGDGHLCTDVDECVRYTHPCDVNANCYNTQGSFNCSCQTGYHGDGHTCSDVDECAMNRANCSIDAICVNTIRSVICTCNAGYTGDGHLCTDVDECVSDTHTCDVNANCSNTQGSFNCVCQTGYHGDGHACSVSLQNAPDTTTVLLSVFTGLLLLLLVISVLFIIKLVLIIRKRPTLTEKSVSFGNTKPNDENQTMTTPSTSPVYEVVGDDNVSAPYEIPVGAASERGGRNTTEHDYVNAAHSTENSEPDTHVYDKMEIDLKVEESP